RVIRSDYNRVQGSDYRVQRSDYRVQRSDYRVQRSDYRVQRSDYNLVGGLARPEEVPVVVVRLDVLELVGPAVEERVELVLREVLQKVFLLLLEMGTLLGEDLPESLRHVLHVHISVAVLDRALLDLVERLQVVEALVVVLLECLGPGALALAVHGDEHYAARLEAYEDVLEEGVLVGDVLDAVAREDVVVDVLSEVVRHRVADRVVHSRVLLVVDAHDGLGQHVGGQVDARHLQPVDGGRLSHATTDAAADVEHLGAVFEAAELLQHADVLVVTSGRDEVLAEHPLIGADARVRVLRLVEEVAEGHRGRVGRRRGELLLAQDPHEVEIVAVEMNRGVELLGAVEVEADVLAGDVASEHVDVVGEGGQRHEGAGVRAEVLPDDQHAAGVERGEGGEEEGVEGASLESVLGDVAVGDEHLVGDDEVGARDRAERGHLIVGGGGEETGELEVARSGLNGDLLVVAGRRSVHESQDLSLRSRHSGDTRSGSERSKFSAKTTRV
ncbi:hypothetical protein PENTCL1PPCAC_19950, partial [Pristionchus entomophagus]